MATRTERGQKKIEWLDALEPAFGEAKRSGKLVLLDGLDPG